MNKFVALSGGIDSTTLALIEPEAQPIFNNTHWEFPELYAHLEKFEQVTGRRVLRLSHWLYPNGIPEYARLHHYLPNHGARWCTNHFKIRVTNRYLKEQRPCELLIGLRADEPLREGNTTNLNGITIRYPLRERGITRLDCVRLCAEHNLLPRYPVYMARGGCIGCFYKRHSEVTAMIALVPWIVDELQELEQTVQDERGEFFHMFPNTGTSIANLRAQPALFSQEQVYREAADRSEMGLPCGLFCNR